MILPSVSDASIPSLTSFPLTKYCRLPFSTIASSRVHSSPGLSTSCRSAKPETILPVLAASPPVHAARRDHLRFSLWIVHVLAVPILANPEGHRRTDLFTIIGESGNRDEIADAPFDDLELERPQPGTVEILARVAGPSLRVDEDAAVARPRLAFSPRHAAPAILDNQPVVAIRLLRQQPAPELTADADGRRPIDLIDDTEHAFGVGLVMIDEPGVEVRQRFPVEELDDRCRRNRVGCRLRVQRGGQRDRDAGRQQREM